jgi:hypothetical protein
MSDFLVIGGWTGRTKAAVKILDVTPEEFRIEALERVMLPGRGFLEKGQSILVSKTVIKHVEAGDPEKAFALLHS